MKWAKGWRTPLWLAGMAAVAGLLFTAAGNAAGDVSYGVSLSKGCTSPTFIGQLDPCFYVFQNVTSPGVGKVVSNDTVVVTDAVDTVFNVPVGAPGCPAALNISPCAGPNSGHILPKLKLVFAPAAPNADAPTCTGGHGAGTALDPYIGATSCTLPWNATISSEIEGWYVTQPADFNVDPINHKLTDQVTFTWIDKCDRTTSRETCDPVTPNDVQAPAATTLKQYLPTITTALSASSIPAGGTVHDTAQITFNTPPPNPPGVSGTVTYNLYTDNTCTTPSAAPNPVLNATVAYNGGAVPDSPAVTFPNAGSFWFQATFSGDAAHGIPAASSVCTEEPLTVGPTAPALATTASPATSVPATLTDTATLSGVTAGAAGSITYHLYSDSKCQNEVAGSPVTAGVSGPGSYVSPGIAVSAAGTYFWRDSYSGDLPTNPAVGLTDCGAPGESTVVGQAAPALTTTASAPTTVPGSLTDTAHLSGVTANAGGTISFVVYSDNTCVTAVGTSNAAVHGPGDYTSSPAITASAPGTYYWRASYTGDVNNAAVGLTPCGAPNESTVVTKRGPAVNTVVVPGGSISVNSTAHDTATLTGATATAGGTIAYTLYSDSNCTTQVANLSPSPATVVNGVVPNSKDFTFTTTGTFYFVASYSGDASNNAAVSGCSAEPITVTGGGGGGGGGTPAISITKNPKAQQLNSGGTANWTIVVTNTGTLTLSNVTVSDPLAPGCNRSSADIPALASMAPGASVTYNCSLANVTQGFTNVATATGTGSNGQTVTAQDTAPVTVVTATAPFTPPVTTPKPAPKPTPAPTPKPKIAIVKDPPSQTIAKGATATFKITVTNTGNTTLSDVTVTDPRSPDCNKHLGTLGVGASKSFTCTRENVKAAYVNIATATGKPPTGARVHASDHANVKVQAFVPPQHPRIAIVKSPKQQLVTTKLVSGTGANGASKTTVTYGDAHFTIKVTNTGDVTLHNVQVADPQASNCVKKLGILAPGKSKSYSCTRPRVTSNFTNVATATGVSPKGTKVKASDHAAVTVKVKTASTSGAKFTG